MHSSRFISLQNDIEQLVDTYLRQHPTFLETARVKDAALKGKTDGEVGELLRMYPGVAAIAAHEAAYRLETSGIPIQKLRAREMAEAAHMRTGIDIHPGAVIGEDCFIDHGTGVVIGETTKIGKRDLIFHDVTLGAYGNPEETNPQKLAHRHPEIGDDCTISVGVKILGNVKIGNGAKICPNVLLFGNHLQVGNNVTIGAGAQVGDGNVIADGVIVGPGAVIPKGIGTINVNVKPYTQVSRGKDNELVFGVTVPQGMVAQMESSFVARLGGDKAFGVPHSVA